MSSLAMRAFATASSVAWTTASKNGSILPHGMNVRLSYRLSSPPAGPSPLNPPGLAVETARKMSPEECEPMVPVRARP